MGRRAPAGAEIGGLLSGDRRSVPEHLYVRLGVVIGADPGVAPAFAVVTLPPVVLVFPCVLAVIVPPHRPVVFPLIAYSLKSL